MQFSAEWNIKVYYIRSLVVHKVKENFLNWLQSKESELLYETSKYFDAENSSIKGAGFLCTMLN